MTSDHCGRQLWADVNESPYRMAEARIYRVEAFTKLAHRRDYKRYLPTNSLKNNPETLEGCLTTDDHFAIVLNPRMSI